MNIRQLRRDIEAATEVVNCEVWQQRPNTAVKVTLRYNGNEYERLGFSKVCWPDEYDPNLGIERAKKKALAVFTKQIADDIRIGQWLKCNFSPTEASSSKDVKI